MPGFVDIHARPGHEPGWEGMLEELGSPKLGQSSLYEFMPLFNAAEYGRHACRVAVSKLLKSGVTRSAISGERGRDGPRITQKRIRAVLWVMFRSPGTGIRSATIWILRGATACFARRLRQRTKPPAMPAAASSASSPLPRLIPAARAKSGRRRARPRAADPDPCGPVHHRVSGNREAIWRNTDRLAGEDRRARRGYRHRPWHFSQRSPVPALPACGRLFAPARQRRASRPLPGCVCTTRHRDEHA